MKLLFLSQVYPPEPATMRHRMAKDLLERGHEIRAITTFPNYPLGKVYPGYSQKLWSRDIVDGARVARLPIIPDHGRSMVRRACSYLSFALTAAILGPIFSGRPQLMWVYHPPLSVGIPALWIAALRRVPIVYEIQDMWPETLAATGMMKSRIVFRMLHAFARLVYRRSAAIVVPSPGMKRNLMAKGVPETKIHVIPNWADEAIYRPVSPSRNLAEREGFSGYFNVIFAGNIGFAQGLETALSAAEMLSSIPEIQFTIIGDGVEAAELRTLVAERGMLNVRFLGRKPEEEMADYLALADVLLVHLRRDPLFEITIPGKTQAYLACGRPILMAVDGDAADVVRDAGAGLTCSPEDSAAMASGIRQLYGMDREKRVALGEAGRKAFLRQYRRSVLVERYVSLFESIAAREEPGPKH